jgi:flavodoxin
MKRLTFLAMLAVVAITAMACNNKKEKSVMNQSEKKTVLVAYFSATGTTAKTAKELAEAANADLFEIQPAQPYTAADLDWHDKNSRSSVEMKDKSSRPEVKGKVADWSQYKTIYIGFPIWWYTAPTIVNTFLEQYDLSGKTIITFCTSGGSTVKGATNDLKKAYPQATWIEGVTNPSTAEIKEFVKKNK